MIYRFTAYRRNLSNRGTHTGTLSNPDEAPQYEGAVFTDGTTVIKWLTPSGGTSSFVSLEKALATHGHPEYGTDIVWHDGAAPEEWTHQLIAHAEHLQQGYHDAGLTDVTLSIEYGENNELKVLQLKRIHDNAVLEQVYPVTKG